MLLGVCWCKLLDGVWLRGIDPFPGRGSQDQIGDSHPLGAMWCLPLCAAESAGNVNE